MNKGSILLLFSLMEILLMGCNQNKTPDQAVQQLQLKEFKRIFLTQASDAINEFTTTHIDSTSILYDSNAPEITSTTNNSNLPLNLQLVPHESHIKYGPGFTSTWKREMSKGKWVFSINSRTIKIQKEDSIAEVGGKYTLTFTPSSKAAKKFTTSIDTGSYTVIWRKENDKKWRADVTSPLTILPLPSSLLLTIY